MKALKKWRVARSPFYRRYPVPDREMMLAIDQRIAVSREKGFIYFRIPKAANSTVATALYDKADAEGYVSRDAKRSFDRASNLTREEVAGLNEKFFLFTVVRDPFSRLLSAYLDQIGRGKPGKRPVAAYYGKALSDPISFLEFCRFIADGGLHANPHWYRQVDFVLAGVDKLHFVARVESLTADLQVICRRVRPDRRHSVEEWTPHRTDATKKMKELYCPETVALVREQYRADFDAFGYAREPEWVEAPLRSS
jgi:hypothetical protein